MANIIPVFSLIAQLVKAIITKGGRGSNRAASPFNDEIYTYLSDASYCNMATWECRDLGHTMLYWQQLKKIFLKIFENNVRNRGSNAFIK